MVINKTLIILFLTLLLTPLILAETCSTPSETTNPGTTEERTITLTPECIEGHFNELNKRVFNNTLGIILVLIAIEIILKGFALWRAVQRNSKPWFVVLLIFHTAGILPLIYLIITRKK